MTYIDARNKEGWGELPSDHERTMMWKEHIERQALALLHSTITLRKSVETAGFMTVRSRMDLRSARFKTQKALEAIDGMIAKEESRMEAEKAA